MTGDLPTMVTSMLLRERDCAGLLLLALLLEGCGYYGCKDDLEREYVPDGEDRWLDDRTLALSFGRSLASPEAVDPRRFALLRYSARIEGGGDYYCSFEVCYDEAGPESAMIPESLSWDPNQPKILQLHFAEPQLGGGGGDDISDDGRSYDERRLDCPG